jgi:hypothetical protein
MTDHRTPSQAREYPGPAGAAVTARLEADGTACRLLGLAMQRRGHARETHELS